ncbi:MAG: tetratricopeptide repeat protein [Bacteroidales bacterium]|nr:tetratricopeptide repeat protein [Bacteroidales bacterium]
MKRLMIIAVIAAFIFGNTNAQDMGAAAPILLNYNTLEKKVEKSDSHINHERKGVKERTWIKRGELFQDVDNFGLEQLQLGIDKTTMKIFYGEPESTEKEDNIEILKYAHMQYYFEDGKLSGWKRIDPIHESPLNEALRSYKKAVELTDEDKKMKTQEKIKDNLEELKNQFLRAGQNDYYHKDYLSALGDFESVLRVNDFPVFEGVVDTLMINYSGIVAREIAARYMDNGEKKKGVEMYKRTLDYYDQLSDLGYGGSSNYIQMTRDYYAIGDTLGAIENLKKGLEQYPDSSLLVTFAAQAYYLLKENEEGLEFLNNRLEEKPECATAYYWKGLLITNEDDLEEEVINQALAYYDTSLIYDPGNGNVLYQSGYVNYAVGANYYEQESYEENPEVREELAAKGKKYYMAAVDKLEKTYDKSEGDYTLQKESLDLLKRIYYKLYGSEDEHYIRTNERLKSL